MDTPSPSKNRGLLFAFLTVIVFGFALFAYIKLSVKNTIPQQFFITYSQSEFLIQKMFPDLTFDFGNLGTYIQNNDIQNANHLVTTALVKSIQNTKRLTAIQQKTAELKPFLSQIADPGARDDATKFIALLDQRNAKLASVISTQTSVFTNLKNFYEAQMSGQQVQLSPDINTHIQSMQQDIQDISQLQFQIDTKYNDLVKSAGINKASLDYANSLNIDPALNSSVVITEAPTPVPTFSEPVGVDASQSADQNASSSALP